jgi:autotransporter adhesin
MKSGIAGVAAMSTLVEPKFKGDTTLAVGVGVYQDAQALAVGLTHHFENGVSGKIAVAADPSAFSDTVVAGASVGYSW